MVVLDAALWRRAVAVQSPLQSRPRGPAQLLTQLTMERCSAESDAKGIIRWCRHSNSVAQLATENSKIPFRVTLIRLLRAPSPRFITLIGWAAR
jgi:hypothetical protein